MKDLEWFSVMGEQTALNQRDHIDRVERIHVPVRPEDIPGMSSEHLLCRHAEVQYRMPTTKYVMVYMCAECYRKILSGTDPNTLGFRSLLSLELKDYLGRLI